MAAETEIERFLVRYTADTSQAKKGAAEMVSLTEQTGQQVEAAGAAMQGGFDQGGEAAKTATLKVRDLRRGLGLLAATSIIPPEASAGVFKAVIGLQLASRTANVAAASMGTFQAALVGTGVGAAVVLIGEMLSALFKFAEASDKAKESAKTAFQNIASGAKTAKQALSELRTTVLSEGLADIADKINPGFFRELWLGAQQLVGRGIDPNRATERQLNAIIERAAATESAFRRLQQSPQARQLIFSSALERTQQAAKDAATAMEEQADRAGLSETAAKQLELAQSRSRQTGIELAQSMRSLGEEFERMNKAQEKISLANLNRQLEDLRNEAGRAGLTDRMQQLVKTFEEFRRDNKALTLAQSLDKLNPQLQEMGNLFNQIDVANFQRGLQDQAATFGLSAERAQLYRLRLQGVSAASLAAAEADVKQLEALRALTAEPGRAPAIRGGTAEAREAVERQRSSQAAALLMESNRSNQRQETLLSGILGVLRAMRPPAGQAAGLQPANFEGI